MIFKTKILKIEVEAILILVILTSIMSNTVFKFLYYYFACYLFIFFHELMHIFTASILNKKLIKIKFSIAGVCAVFEKEKYKENTSNLIKNVCIYLAGPISNLILAYIFKSNTMIKEINIFLAILNIVPIFPLDGYNVLMNLLKMKFDCNKVNDIINVINNILLFILVIICIYQIKLYINFSLSIFCIYIYILKLTQNKVKNAYISS